MAGDFTEPWSEDEAMDEDENGFILAVDGRGSAERVWGG